MPRTLYFYIARQFLIWFTTVFLTLLVVIFMLDLIELIRRAAARPDVTMGLLLEMTALKLPFTAQEAMPFAILFGSMMALWKLTRSHELIVTRAAGISVWQFLTPAIAIAFIIGATGVTIFNPLASITQAIYKEMDDRLLRSQPASMLISTTGLWLRQSDASGTQAVIHGARISEPEMVISDISIIFFRDNDRLTGRIDAQSGHLGDGQWILNNAWTWEPDHAPVFSPTVTVPTNLTPQKIEESFASPETMSFWQLPGFIDLLKRSGFSSQRHQLYFDSLLARPFLLCAMVLIAAIFSLRMQRRGRTAVMILGGVASGFLLYFLSDIVFALGSSSTIPVALAAWTPAGVSLLLGATFLLHLEDG